MKKAYTSSTLVDTKYTDKHIKLLAYHAELMNELINKIEELEADVKERTECILTDKDPDECVEKWEAKVGDMI